MTINGFGILLILVERIKRDKSKLEKVFNATGRIGTTNELI